MEQQEIKSDGKKAEECPIPVTQGQIECLRSCITKTIDTYRGKRNKNKCGAIIVQGLAILFSFGTTVLIGWKLNMQPEDVKNGSLKISPFTNFVLVVSALATGINALNQFFDYKPLWIGYNISIAKLKALLAKVDYLDSLGAEKLKRSQLDDIFNRYEEIYGNMNKSYETIRSAKDE